MDFITKWLFLFALGFGEFTILFFLYALYKKPNDLWWLWGTMGVVVFLLVLLIPIRIIWEEF